MPTANRLRRAQRSPDLAAGCPLRRPERTANSHYLTPAKLHPARDASAAQDVCGYTDATECRVADPLRFSVGAGVFREALLVPREVYTFLERLEFILKVSSLLCQQ